VLSLLQTDRWRPRSRRVSGREGRVTASRWDLAVRVDENEEAPRMKLVYLVLSLLPTLAVVTLAWCVVRAISVRVVWRETGERRLDDGPA
jgi:hypothetical protein